MINDMLQGNTKVRKMSGQICRAGTMMLRSAELEAKYGDGDALPVS